MNQWPAFRPCGKSAGCAASARDWPTQSADAGRRAALRRSTMGAGVGATFRECTDDHASRCTGYLAHTSREQSPRPVIADDHERRVAHGAQVAPPPYRMNERKSSSTRVLCTFTPCDLRASTNSSARGTSSLRWRIVLQVESPCRTNELGSKQRPLATRARMLDRGHDAVVGHAFAHQQPREARRDEYLEADDGTSTPLELTSRSKPRCSAIAARDTGSGGDRDP